MIIRLVLRTADLIAGAEDIGGVKLIVRQLEGASVDDMRGICDAVRKAEKSVILVLASVSGDKATIMTCVSDDLTGRYNAGKLIKEIAKAAGGGGGGKADMAQAGAKDISKLPEALALAKTLVANC